MADIQFRFGKDMLVLSGSLDKTLAQQGINAAADMPFLVIMEPDTIVDALHLQAVAGAQCMVTPTHNITPAHLAYLNMQADGMHIAKAALDIVQQTSPQHILVDIGPSGLPLDVSSKNSLNENKDQYTKAARFFEGLSFDAFFLNGFTSLDDVRCALMGLRQVSDKPIFASMQIGYAKSHDSKASEGTRCKNDFDPSSINKNLPLSSYTLVDDWNPIPSGYCGAPLDPSQWPQAVALMVEYEASVIGFETADALNLAYDYAIIARHETDRPLLASLRSVNDPYGAKDLGLTPLEELQEYTPETLYRAGEHLREAGVQFLRATGDALAANTGSLVAATSGLDVIPQK